MSIFLCSNVNINSLVQQINKCGAKAFGQVGYGNEFEPFLNKNSNFWESKVEDALILVCGDALFASCTTHNEALAVLNDWFGNLEACIDAPHNFYVSDIVCTQAPFFSDCKHNPARELEAKFSEKLDRIMQKHANVFRFDQSSALINLGLDKAFSEKMWYLARIPYSTFAVKALADKIVSLANRAVPKKVMVVDLDNTLWGGVVGEVGARGITLCDEHTGLIYKDVQRQLLRMKQAGVLLAIVSKNNFDDAALAFRENAHMVLSLDDFVSTKINWENKDRNIVNIAAGLNLGLDSFVFLDDNPTERDLVAHSLPEVQVVDFPNDVSRLPAVLKQVYDKHFKRAVLVEEDLQKTQQYKAMSARENLKQKTGNFDDYLKQLEIVAKKIDPSKHTSRICQLITKTNQFNLTTKRYSSAQVQTMIETPSEFGVFAFEISDKFGNNGITALAIVKLEGSHAFIDTLILSCRIMGKQIENFVIDYIEKWCIGHGVERLFAIYIPTKKNAPVRSLFNNLGYDVISESAEKTEYSLILSAKQQRHYFVQFDWK